MRKILFDKIRGVSDNRVRDFYMVRTIGFIAAVMAIVLFLADTGNSAVITIAADNTFSGTSPSGPAPWLVATFDDHGNSGSVSLTLSTSGLQNGEFVSKWSFNFDPAFALASLIFTQTQGPIPTIGTGTNAFKMDGDGYYDIQFSFPTNAHDRFSAGTALFTITAPGITSQSFMYFSDSPNYPYLSAAHVQGIAAGDGSGWVSLSDPAPDPAPVPIPAPLILLSSGLLGLIGLGRTLKRDGKGKAFGGQAEGKL